MEFLNHRVQTSHGASYWTSKWTLFRSPGRNMVPLQPFTMKYSCFSSTHEIKTNASYPFQNSDTTWSCALGWAVEQPGIRNFKCKTSSDVPFRWCHPRMLSEVQRGITIVKKPRARNRWCAWSSHFRASGGSNWRCWSARVWHGWCRLRLSACVLSVVCLPVCCNTSFCVSVWHVARVEAVLKMPSKACCFRWFRFSASGLVRLLLGFLYLV